MRRTKKLFWICAGCAGLFIALALTAVLVTQLLANREMVKAFIVSESDQVTGGKLTYDRLDLSVFPMPHLVARDVHLLRPEKFEARARQLSVYPAILPILKGRFVIRRLAVAAPEFRVSVGSMPRKVTASPSESLPVPLEASFQKVLGGIFATLAAIDPNSQMRIDQGRLTLVFANAPDIRVSEIDATLENDKGELTLNLNCASSLAESVNIEATADIGGMQADGTLSLTDFNLRPLLMLASLPGAIVTTDTRASVAADFTIDKTDAVDLRFRFQAPSLTLKRKSRALKIGMADLSGSLLYKKGELSLALDALKALQPALDLSAAASLKSDATTGRRTLHLKAMAAQLDVQAAGEAARAIAGDLAEIQSAFDVAKKGRLVDATYWVDFDQAPTGWQLTRMKATSHLARAVVAIPGIDADIENLEGDVVYEGARVGFKNAGGYFKGAAFKKLDAAIDWENEPTLSIASTSVNLDAAPFYTWLTSFEGLAGIKDRVSSMDGICRISVLRIDGPLTQPQKWVLAVTHTPQNLRLTGPLVPFETRLSGGVITYTPEQLRSSGVRLDFLDGSLVASSQIHGIVQPEATTWHIDGSLGQAAIDWLSTVLPIPAHLQMKPPVELSGLTLGWKRPHTFLLTGEMKTAGGVDLYADFTHSPSTWRVRRLEFSDGQSRATIAARREADAIEFSFAGNVEKQTADRLLRDNRSLSGRLEGDFQIRIDPAAPLNSSMTGKLAGNGLKIHRLTHTPIDLKAFAVKGHGNRLEVAPSEVVAGDSALRVSGTLAPRDGDLSFDLDVAADRLDETLLQAFKPADSQNDAAVSRKTASTIVPRGNIHLQTTELTAAGFTWSPVKADIRINGNNTHVRVHEADLCGISTTGELNFAPHGLSLNIAPNAIDASLQQTAACLWQRKVTTDARYALFGSIRSPPTRENLVQSLSGQLTFSSENGRIHYAEVLMKVISVLNLTEVFAGGKSDFTEKGYGYNKASVKATIDNGKVQLQEILLDGKSLKITGQGSIDLNDQMVNINLLAAPLKSVDRIVDKLPMINYITGGSLISIPLRVHGKIDRLSVVPLSPAAVGKGLLNVMQRTLKAPFKLVESAAKSKPEPSAGTDAPPVDSPQGP